MLFTVWIRHPLREGFEDLDGEDQMKSLAAFSRLAVLALSPQLPMHGPVDVFPAVLGVDHHGNAAFLLPLELRDEEAAMRIIDAVKSSMCEDTVTRVLTGDRVAAIMADDVSADDV